MNFSIPPTSLNSPIYFSGKANRGKKTIKRELHLRQANIQLIRNERNRTYTPEGYYAVDDREYPDDGFSWRPVQVGKKLDELVPGDVTHLPPDMLGEYRSVKHRTRDLKRGEQILVTEP